MLWFAGVGLGLKLWVYWLRPVRSWYYSAGEAVGLTRRVGVALVTAVVIGLAGIPVMALAQVLGGLTVIVIIMMAPLTLIAYRDKLDRDGVR
jgi:hypothetical protein